MIIESFKIRVKIICSDKNLFSYGYIYKPVNDRLSYILFFLHWKCLSLDPQKALVPDSDKHDKHECDIANVFKHLRERLNAEVFCSRVLSGSELLLGSKIEIWTSHQLDIYRLSTESKTWTLSDSEFIFGLKKIVWDTFKSNILSQID